MPRDAAETVIDWARNLIDEDLPGDVRLQVLADMLNARLTPEQLDELMNATIVAADTGAPPPAFEDMAAELEGWCALASPKQLSIVAWHAIRRLPVERRADLIRGLMLDEAADA